MLLDPKCRLRTFGLILGTRAVTDNEIADLLTAVPLPMMSLAGDGRVVATNRACDAVLGAGVKGRHFITALRQPSVIEAIETVMQTRKPVQSRYLGREGQRDTTYLVHVAPVGDATVLTFEDRTAAEDIGALRREFVANVSHELRTPLTALHGFIETLRGPAKDDATARERFLAIMERETGRMTQLVGDLLSLSRVEENERVRPDTPIVLGHLVRTALAELEPVVGQAGGTVALKDDSKGCAIPGDPGQIRQVIGNLVENAAKYGAEGQVVTVQITALADQVLLRGKGLQLSVHNSGEAIAPHHLARLTERFYRVDSHRSRDVGGTGLGLAIVKHIVNRHRGRLQIESSTPAGTTVTVTLPAADPASAG